MSPDLAPIVARHAGRLSEAQLYGLAIEASEHFIEAEMAVCEIVQRPLMPAGDMMRLQLAAIRHALAYDQRSEILRAARVGR